MTEREIIRRQAQTIQRLSEELAERTTELKEANARIQSIISSLKENTNVKPRS